MESTSREATSFEIVRSDNPVSAENSWRLKRTLLPSKTDSCIKTPQVGVICRSSFAQPEPRSLLRPRLTNFLRSLPDARQGIIVRFRLPVLFPTGIGRFGLLGTVPFGRLGAAICVSILSSDFRCLQHILPPNCGLRPVHFERIDFCSADVAGE